MTDKPDTQISKTPPAVVAKVRAKGLPAAIGRLAELIEWVGAGSTTMIDPGIGWDVHETKARMCGVALAMLAEEVRGQGGRTRAELVAMREQSVAVCERRTRELEDLRSLLERQRSDAILGAAVRELTDQLKRLRRNPCETMRFGLEPDDIAAAVRSETREVQAEAIGSDAARRETGGVLACALHLMIVHAAPVTWTIEAEARRLRMRLDVVEAGGTWEEAKAAEVAAMAVPPDWLTVGARVEDCDALVSTVLLICGGKALVDYGEADGGPAAFLQQAWWPIGDLRPEGWRDDPSAWEPT